METFSPIDSAMTMINLTRAKLHVYNVCNQGTSIALIRSLTTNEVGDRTTESELTLKAFPIRISPFDREIMQKISWSEDADIICFVSKKAIELLDMTLLQMQKKYIKLRHQSKLYDVKYIEYYGAFAGDFLYVVIGGKK